MNNRVCKYFYSLTLMCLLVLASVVIGAAQKRTESGEGHSRRCGLQTLNGTYGYTASGTVFMGGSPFAVAGVGWIEFDGNGGGDGHDTTSWGGMISEADITATYSVNENCSGTLTMLFPGPYPAPANFVIIDNGRRIKFVVTIPGNVVTGEMVRQ